MNMTLTGRRLLLAAFLLAALAATLAQAQPRSGSFSVLPGSGLGGGLGRGLGRPLDTQSRAVQPTRIRSSCSGPCQRLTSSGDCVRKRRCSKRGSRRRVLA